MKQFSYILLTVMAAMMAASCVDEIENSDSTSPDVDLVEKVFRASFAGDTKTALTDGLNVSWLPGDEIAVNGKLFTTDIEKPSYIADFGGSVEESDSYYALYPFSMMESFDGENYIVNLPEVQVAHKGGFADDLNLSVAHAWSNQPLQFHNLLGYVKFSVNESSGDICSLTVRSNDGYSQVWASSAQVYSYNHFIHLYDGEDARSSVQLVSDDVLEAGDYYIALWPRVFYDGLSFDFEREDGYVATLSINREIELQAGEIKNIGLLKNLDFKPSKQMQLQAEKEALIALYDSTGGDSWNNNTNWCSDKPLSEWYGVSLDPEGYVQAIWLSSNNLTGSIPEKISGLTHLERLNLEWNSLQGSIPEGIVEMSRLYYLNLRQNQLSGSIPEKIGKLPLTWVDLSWNQLTGNIPVSVAELMNENLVSLNINHNMLAGKVPAAIYENEYFNEHWVNMIYQDGYLYILDVSDAKIKAPVFETEGLDGSVINSGDIYKDNVYTVLFHWGTGCGFSMAFIPKLKAWYEEYKECGVEVIAYSGDDLADVKSVVESNGLTWKNFKLEQFSDLFSDNIYLRDAPLSPFVAVVDKDGYIIHNPINDDREKIIDLFEEKWGDLGSGEDNGYVSEDYSEDGNVKQLQAAFVGNGIDIVIMGDGYSDRQIADGTYDADMNNAYKAMFSVEPYNAYQNLFNVYSVTAVSKNEGYAEGNETVFKGWLSDAGSAVGGNDETVQKYARKAVADLSEALIIVVMNDLRYGGTCYMYYGGNATGDWGSGMSIAYLPLSSSSSNETFAQVLNHEAGGHGFGKLVDEYYSGEARITDEDIAKYKEAEQYGFYKNGDFTDDVNGIKWKHLLADPRYAGEVGIYEGGFAYYRYGVYRPTENSIMNDNTGGFNAPSREAIWYRIHKLAYGADWEYNYETFVQYDAVNRKNASESAVRKNRRTNYVEKAFIPTAPPVLIRSDR